jgi:Zn-dependent peptidase ImmA (M78 family)
MTETLQLDNAASLLLYAESKGLKLVAPIDVDEIARILGITVEYDVSLESKNIIGEISFPEGVPLVKINPFQNTYDPRRRFTLAHEIGHYCLHSLVTKQGFSDSQKTMSRSESFWNSKESEANSFAAQLLMPKSLLIKEGNRIIDDYKESTESTGMPVSKFVEVMAHLFGVSNKAMEYRLKNLRIIA